MNRIDTSQVTDPGIQQPWTTKSLKFLQDSVVEAVSLVAQSTSCGPVGDFYNSPYAIDGLYKYVSSSSTFVAPGTFFASDSGVREIFYCPGGNITSFTTPVLVPDYTNSTSIDPILFSDGSPRSIHNIRRFKIVENSSYSGSFPAIQYNSIKFANWPATRLRPTSTKWTGFLFAVKINNIVHLSGSLRHEDPTLDEQPGITLPTQMLSGYPVFLSLSYVGHGSSLTPYTAIWKIGTDGALTIPNDDPALSYVHFTSNGNTFYFDGVSYYPKKNEDDAGGGVSSSGGGDTDHG